MMESDTFNLEQNGDANRFGKNYMSLSRLRTSATGYGEGVVRMEDGPAVRIELDGRALNNVRHVNVRPYSYFNNVVKNEPGFEGTGEDYSEFEDSLTLKDGSDQIKDAVDYVARVDILLHDHIGRYMKDWNHFLQCMNMYPDWAAKTHFFTNVNDFDYQQNEIPRNKIYSLYSEEFKQALEENKMGRNIYITESQLGRILAENEIITEAVNKVDNFDLIGNLINLTDQDKFFFVQIVKRWKDNKDKNGADAWRQAGRQAGTYHRGGDFGNFASGTAFKVRSKQELDSLKPQIVAYCDKNNARAYITSNPRSESAINTFLPQYLQKQANKNGGVVPDYDQKYGFEHLAGQAKVYDPVKFPDRVRLMFDIDTEKNTWYVPSTAKQKIHCKRGKSGALYVDDTRYPQLANCESRILDQSHAQVFLPKYPNQEQALQSIGGVNVWEDTKAILAANNIPIETEYETPSHGLHIIIQDISKASNFRKVEAELRKYDDGHDVKQYQLVHANFDGKLILYSNVDTSGY